MDLLLKIGDLWVRRRAAPDPAALKAIEGLTPATVVTGVPTDQVSETLLQPAERLIDWVAPLPPPVRFRTTTLNVWPATVVIVVGLAVLVEAPTGVAETKVKPLGTVS